MIRIIVETKKGKNGYKIFESRIEGLKWINENKNKIKKATLVEIINEGLMDNIRGAASAVKNKVQFGSTDLNKLDDKGLINAFTKYLSKGDYEPIQEVKNFASDYSIIDQRKIQLLRNYAAKVKTQTGEVSAYNRKIPSEQTDNKNVLGGRKTDSYNSMPGRKLGAAYG